MPCCGGDDASVASKEIDKKLKKDNKALKDELKLLLLGAGESGKSTIVKQMQIIHKDGFSDEDRSQGKPIIFENVLSSMKVIIAAMEQLGIKLADSANQTHCDFINGKEEYDMEPEDYNAEFFGHIKSLWADNGIKECYNRSNEYQLNDSAGYFFDNVNRLVEKGYNPSEMDMLRMRIVTTGIFETRFQISGVQFHMFDVGGQRSERRKWIQCFGDVTAIIFVVAASAYDQVLREDASQNRLRESLELFQNIWKNRWLEKVSVILFLNKEDLLEEKIRVKALPADEFPDYNGGNNPEAAKAYIKDIFMKIGRETEHKRVYPHFTTAISTENVKRVFDACKDIIQQLHLMQYGLV
ncbi:guanine nucleotide binding protein [Capsaspora owczarzaki ATCC 30864]|uniref:Adenylate cyclase-stimulating G alpha protein n=1 Tax=Capsaspora owczarzaki (strain ATCC 30864) TaxID=595528 RepID=A0A0D2WRN6_CAPO3|nr:guanine nucleotide binding protein [Capsaspora owczarzaki ATCC 30864]KJE93958.1 guanine nucleotide binding protein [Capsaspora owczarzaki ATCC 30864]|eukprot:XP_004347414.2 guanine nucleotide binding protein [Capsaspora owczarzaki ATCC 30864]